MSLLRLMLRLAFGAAIVLLIGAALLILTPKYRQINHLRNERDRLQQDNAKTEQLIAELRNKQRRFAHDPEFVERIARRGRRARSDETVFVLESENRNPISD